MNEDMVAFYEDVLYGTPVIVQWSLVSRGDITSV